ncbi:hypothetical protein EG68_03790, partial [Paragonimus skrjabini miyazakii]
NDSRPDNNFNTPLSSPILSIGTSQIVVGPDERLQFAFDHGSNLSVTLTVAGQPVDASVDYANKRVLSEPLSVSQASQIAYAITVANPLGNQNKSGLVDFIESISGNERLRIGTSQIAIGPDERLQFSFDHGSNLSVTLTVAGQPVGASVDYANKHVQFELLSAFQVSQTTYATTLANPLGDQHKSGLVDFIKPISDGEHCVFSNNPRLSI